MTTADFAAGRSAGHALFDALRTIDDSSVRAAAEHQELLDENAELRCRVQELEAERDALAQRIEDLEWNYAGKLPGAVKRV